MYRLLFRFLCLWGLLGLGIAARSQGTGAWYIQDFTGAAPEKRHESAFVNVAGKFYLIGGRGNKTIQVYDPQTGQWSNTGSTTANIHHFQAVVWQGKIYIIGALTAFYPDEDPVANVMIYDPVTDQLSTGATIPVDRRRGSSGVVVYNNKFYIVAGHRNGHNAFLDDGVTPANVAWFDEYDPVNDTWRALADAPHARDHFFAEVIGNRLYVAGGRRSKNGATGGTFGDTEGAVDVYDFQLGRWLTAAETPDDIPTRRAGAPVAYLGGELLVMGGEIASNPPDNLALNVTEALNPATGTWRTLAPLNMGRHATQAIVYNNDIYVAAGSRTRGGTEITATEPFLEAFSHDGPPGQVDEYPVWTTVGYSEKARSESQTVLYNGELYFFNGFAPNIKIENSVEKYNPATNTWTTLAPMPLQAGGKPWAVTHNGIALVNTDVWIVGGRVGDNPGPVTNKVWIYSITGNSWREGPPLPFPAGGGGVGRLGRRLHYVGGFDPQASCDVNVHLVYDLDNPTAGWQDRTATSPLPMPRNHFGTTVLGGKLYVIGGQNGHDGCGSGTDVNLVHVYDPATDAWTQLASFPNNQSHIEPCTFTLDGKIYVVGGQILGNRVKRYDPPLDQWTELTDYQLPQALLAPGARVIGPNMVVANGGAPGTTSPTNITRLKSFARTPLRKLGFNPDAVSVTLVTGQQRTVETILYNLAGEDETTYQISTANLPAWLTVSGAGGTARECFAEVSLHLDAGGLNAGTYTHTLTASAPGYTAASLSVTLVVTDDGNPPPTTSFWLEAECAAVGSAWSTANDAAASGGKYVVRSTGSSLSSPPSDIAANRVRFSLSVPTAGSYYLSARLRAPTSNDDSFWVRVNGGNWIQWSQSLQTGTVFAWKTVTGSPFALVAGPNTIDFAYREDGAQLDKMYLSPIAQLPTGTGSVASNCGTPAPNEAPVAVASANPLTGTAPLTVGLNGAASSDSDGTITAYAWAWPGGTAAGVTTSITFSQAGTYAVSLTVTDDDGATDTDVVTVTVNPPSSGTSSIALEAECATVGTNWQTLTDAGASNGKYVVIAPGNNSLSAPPAATSANLVKFSFSVAQTGGYYLFGRLKAPSSNDDSFWVRVNGGTWIQWSQSLQTGTAFAWKPVTASPFQLAAGQHLIEVAFREDGTQLDKLFLSTTNQAPTGTGPAAVNCTVSGNQPPNAAAAASPTSGTAPLTVNLDGSGSSDPDGTITSYAWAWTGGGAASGIKPTISLATAGTYAITLTITDDGGATDTDVVTVTVQGSTATQGVVSFTLFNADTDQPIGTLTEGMVINLSTLGNPKLDVRANTNPPVVGSVRFSLSGATTHTRTESTPDYALFGNSGDDYYGRYFNPGNHTLSGTAYTGSGATGTAYPVYTVNFQVVQSAALSVPATAGTAQIYPNPVTDRLFIRFDLPDSDEPLRITLFDVHGKQLLHREEYAAPGVGTTEVWLGSLPAGTYLLRLQSGSYLWQEKVVKSR